MGNIQFEDNSIQVKDAIKSNVIAGLYEVAQEIVSQTVRNYDKAGRNQTGQTKGSFKEIHVDDDSLTATMGSNYETLYGKNLELVFMQSMVTDGKMFRGNIRTRKLVNGIPHPESPDIDRSSKRLNH